MGYLIHNGRLETPVFEGLILILILTWFWIFLSIPED